MSRRTRGVWHVIGSGVLWALALSGCASSLPPSLSMRTASNPAAVDSDVVHSLRRQLKERDKRIEKLESQLDALKLIDQDFEKQRTPGRQPVVLTPSD